MSSGLSWNPFSIPLTVGANACLFSHGAPTIHTKLQGLSAISCTRPDDSRRATDQQQLSLSVLRFTLGIPGLDESYLPRWIGYAFGSLLLLNHFVGSNPNTTTPAQLRSEVLGLSLAAFSIALPSLGKFLKGATPVDQTTLPEGAEQIFAMSLNLPETLKEELAWGTYVLLRNTKTISVLILVQNALCIRGYWSTPKDVAKVHVLDWFEKQIEETGLSNLSSTIYFPQCADSEIWEMLPKGTRSLLVWPLLQAPDSMVSSELRKQGTHGSSQKFLQAIHQILKEKNKFVLRAFSQKRSLPEFDLP